jgi:hypothetical protein
MKSLYSLFLLVVLLELCTEETKTYELFDSSTFEELANQIQAYEKSIPEKDKWMKEAEYQNILNEYLENTPQDEFIYKVPFEKINVPCSAYYGFCYDVEEEKLKITYDPYDKLFETSFLVSVDYSTYEGQTDIQKNLNTSTTVEKTVRYEDNLKISLKDAISISLPMPIGEIKNKEEEFSSFITFSVKLPDSTHRVARRQKVDIREPKISYPYEIYTLQKVISGNYLGVLIERNDQIIFDSTTDNMSPDNEDLVLGPPPIFKVNPAYPRRAQERGTEGYAIVNFTISKKGTVKDPYISEGKCRSMYNRGGEYADCSMFNTVSIKAAKKMKFDPVVVDGVAVEVPDQMHKFSFEIE